MVKESVHIRCYSLAVIFFTFFSNHYNISYIFHTTIFLGFLALDSASKVALRVLLLYIIVYFPLYHLKMFANMKF